MMLHGRKYVKKSAYLGRSKESLDEVELSIQLDLLPMADISDM